MYQCSVRGAAPLRILWNKPFSRGIRLHNFGRSWGNEGLKRDQGKATSRPSEALVGVDRLFLAEESRRQAEWDCEWGTRDWEGGPGIRVCVRVVAYL